MLTDPSFHHPKPQVCTTSCPSPLLTFGRPNTGWPENKAQQSKPLKTGARVQVKVCVGLRSSFCSFRYRLNRSIGRTQAALVMLKVVRSTQHGAKHPSILQKLGYIPMPFFDSPCIRTARYPSVKPKSLSHKPTS